MVHLFWWTMEMLIPSVGIFQVDVTVYVLTVTNDLF